MVEFLIRSRVFGQLLMLCCVALLTGGPNTTLASRIPNRGNSSRRVAGDRHPDSSKKQRPRTRSKKTSDLPARAAEMNDNHEFMLWLAVSGGLSDVRLVQRAARVAAPKKRAPSKPQEGAIDRSFDKYVDWLAKGSPEPTGPRNKITAMKQALDGGKRTDRALEDMRLVNRSLDNADFAARLEEIRASYQKLTSAPLKKAGRKPGYSRGVVTEIVTKFAALSTVGLDTDVWLDRVGKVIEAAPNPAALRVAIYLAVREYRSPSDIAKRGASSEHLRKLGSVMRDGTANQARKTGGTEFGELKDVPVCALTLAPRTVGVLENAGVHTVGDWQKSLAKGTKLTGVGAPTADQITAAVEALRAARVD